MKQVIVFFCLGCLFGCVLAQNKQSGRIVNGTAVSADIYSFLVQMYYFGQFFCGASIITPRHVLTAAHCFVSIKNPIPKNHSFIELVGGSSDLYSGIIFSVQGYIIHPEYVGMIDERRRENDAAIVAIKGSFADYKTLSAIPLPTKDLTYAPDNPTWCFMAGWGDTYSNSGVSNKLLLVWTQVISQYVCQKRWAGGETITSQMVCVNLPNTSACRGDSGGPLVCNGELVGINSFGDRYCTGSPPSVFANVASNSIRSFIKKYTDV